MKKSIVAMLSITALATVANAASFVGTTGTDFEVKENNTPFTVNDQEYDPVLDTTGYFWYSSSDWTNEEAVVSGGQLGTCTYTNGLSAYQGARPVVPGRDATSNEMALYIDTEGQRLFRRITSQGNQDNGVKAFDQYDVTSAIYFDSLVQFTVNEDGDTLNLDSGDKLAVWLKGGDTTNLVITAGWFDESQIVTSNYVINTNVVNIAPGTWHRLTIESFKLASSSGAMPLGFRVFIDETVVSSDTGSGDLSSWLAVVDENAEISSEVAGYVTAKTLFPSLVNESGTNCDTLSCVAFDGTGAVDDITFTDKNPFESVGPTVDGVGVDATNVFITARSNKPIVYPTAPTITTNGEGVVSIGFAGTSVDVPEWYDVSSADGLTVNLTLNNNALPTIGAANVEEVAKEAIEVAATEFTATLTGTNTKLYYGLKVATSPNAAEENWALGELKQGTGGAMQLTADKPTVSGGSDPALAGFFKVYVTDIAPTSAQGK